ncbi:hormogonium polysaccharide secretion pseudopilin HpsB [Microcoleus sp. FACHB-831]|jgi:prepilin-type N-terminal cleavage/methylation domain-containing protein|uniref:hormogonium polysaccharide secretion pseudopilin HpsB n=1 Tax=Microcoleus sp. FACHB-831 TaxID=2692827 RepID=UPI0018EF8E84|nr:hormogonium polysaccharide secretion pseudopilin HpsB [Microcoleus sp. FACHB-831]
MKRKQKQHIPHSSQAGFTLIESLVAIIVVAVLLTAMAPVMVLSTATRMQSKRVERGVEASKAYINALQSRAIPAPAHTVQVVGEYKPPTTVGGKGEFTSKRGTFTDAPAPSAADFTCTTPGANGYCKNTPGATLYCFDIDGIAGCDSTSQRDLIVQAVRSTTVANGSDDSDKGYLMMVRVYRADALRNGGLLKTQKLQGQKQATSTAGMGARLLPLVEMTTEIRPARPDYQDFCDRISCKN